MCSLSPRCRIGGDAGGMSWWHCDARSVHPILLVVFVVMDCLFVEMGRLRTAISEGHIWTRGSQSLQTLEVPRLGRTHEEGLARKAK